MYLMYVDDTGDSGLINSPTRYFGLSGLVVHETSWRAFIDALIQFKRTMKQAYGLPVRAEIHSAEYIYKSVHGLQLFQRIAILRNFLDELAKLGYISVTHVLVDKQGKSPNYDVFETAWKLLFQRFENTLKNGNFPGRHQSDHGIVITDDTHGEKLVRLMRRMAVYNLVPSLPPFQGSRNLPVTRIIEDPYCKDSARTLPIQACDVCAYFLKQRFQPNGRIRRFHAQYYFDRLLPVLNTHASRTHALGIVEI